MLCRLLPSVVWTSERRWDLRKPYCFVMVHCSSLLWADARYKTRCHVVMFVPRRYWCFGESVQRHEGAHGQIWGLAAQISLTLRSWNSPRKCFSCAYYTMQMIQMRCFNSDVQLQPDRHLRAAAVWVARNTIPKISKVHPDDIWWNLMIAEQVGKIWYVRLCDSWRTQLPRLQEYISVGCRNVATDTVSMLLCVVSVLS